MSRILSIFETKTTRQTLVNHSEHSVCACIHFLSIAINNLLKMLSSSTVSDAEQALQV